MTCYYYDLYYGKNSLIWYRGYFKKYFDSYGKLEL